MRLSFPNGEHPELIVSSGSVDIGSAEGNAVSVEHSGLLARHARLTLDTQRGTLLELLDGAATAHVNGRPVRQRALVRLGDVLSLGELQLLIKPDRDLDVQVDISADAPAASEGAQQIAASRVVLRGVGGALFGRSFPLVRTLVLGRGGDVDIRLDDAALAERHAQLENHGDYVVLRHLDGTDGTVVNGVPVSDAVLHPGDQLAVEHYRFVLEAPGLPQRGSMAFEPARRSGPVTQTMAAVKLEPGQDSGTGPAGEDSTGNVWWLIAAAVAIMLALAALLIYAPGLLG